MDTFGKRVSYIRKQILQQNQVTFAKHLHISQGALSDIEHEKRGLPQEAIIGIYKLSKTHNFSFDWFLLGEGDIEPPPGLSSEEQELLSHYARLDSRGQHMLYATLYQELDRIDREHV